MIPNSQATLQLSSTSLASPPPRAGRQVKLDDLTWMDRDRVLRLLFAKINSVQGKVSSLPSHTLEPHAPGRSLAGSATVNSSIM